jgi:hypothetical protein
VYLQIRDSNQPQDENLEISTTSVWLEGIIREWNITVHGRYAVISTA